MKIKETSPWGKINKAEAKRLKAVATTGMVGGRSKTKRTKYMK